MSARSKLGWMVMFCAVPASADKGAVAPTNVTAVPKIEVVQQPSFASVACGSALTTTLMIKNLGNAFSSKVVLNGVETAFSLAKDETKTVTGKGGTLDCAKAPPTIAMKIPSPAGTGPLFQKSFAPATVAYANAQAAVAAGGTFAINVPGGAICGSPMTIYAKSTVTSLPVTVSVLDQKLTATIPGGGNKSLVTTKNFDCALPPPTVRYYTTSPEWLDLAPLSVSYK